MGTTYVPPKVVEKINTKAKLLDVATEVLGTFRKSGANFVIECPVCNTKKKLSISPSKDIWKCHKCDVGSKGAISFVQEFTDHKTFPEACHYLAKMYHIPIEEKAVKKNGQSKIPFRNTQLQLSGILETTQAYTDKDGKQKNRYEAGSLDKFGKVVKGFDMIIHYLGLDWEPLTFKNSKGKLQRFTRIRYANPSLSIDKHGNPVRYRSPYKSGSHLYIPNVIIHAFNAEKAVDTLIVIEGEKKADKLCQHGFYAVAVGGIHNFDIQNEMPYQFQQIIEACGVKKVVFMLDSDWQDLSKSKKKIHVDQRPKTFYRSVLKFKKYFNAYHNHGIDLNIFFGYTKDDLHKGVDDLLVLKLKEKEGEFLEDFNKALIDRAGAGEYVQLHDITMTTDYQLKEFWHLHNAEAFMKAHFEELKDLKRFMLEKIERRWDEETKKFEFIQKLMDYEQYWTEDTIEDEWTGEKKIRKVFFDYVNIYDFLRNRGFGIYWVNNKNFRMVQVENKVVREVTPMEIQKFVIEFTKSLNKKLVLAMLYRGHRQYLGQEKLQLMHYLPIKFNQSDESCQYLYFKNGFVKITKDKIEHRPLSELPYNVWQDKIIDFDFKPLVRPMTTLHRKGNKWEIKEDSIKKNCHMAMFYYNTSCFFWKKEQELIEEADGTCKYVARTEKQPLTKEEIKSLKDNYAAKILATGYILHEHRDWSQMKAVICMDGVETEIGKSQGGTGKSLFSKQFKHMVPTFVINGKKLDPRNPDNHLFDGVDERTGVVVINDVRVNFDFENFFGDITEGVEVNPKGEKKFTVDPPKFIVSTNHAINGNDTSHSRRQFLLSFSDYYNNHRTPFNDFGQQLFYDWDYDQWNLYYNFIAACIQNYLKHGLKYTIPMEAIERRKLRQQMGESFLEWAEDIFDSKSPYKNHALDKRFLIEDFLEKYPKERRYCDSRKFKARIKTFCIYSKTVFNPQFQGERHKSNGKEYFTIADEKFDANNYKLVHNWGDVDEVEGPFN